MIEGVPVIMKIRDRHGLEWSVVGVLADWAERPHGQSRPATLVLKPGASVTSITVVEQSSGGSS